jgi:hypothetical protein
VSVMLLLAADRVELYPPGELDGHGWREPPGQGARSCWDGTGNLQLATGPSDPRASEGGGQGPNAPRRDEVGNLFLPLGSEPADGMTAVIRGQVFTVSEVRMIADPVAGPGGGIACWAATVTEAPRG